LRKTLATFRKIGKTLATFRKIGKTLATLLAPPFLKIAQNISNFFGSTFSKNCAKH
jgi:hypothetical protein